MKKRIEKLSKEELDRIVAEKVMGWTLVTDQIGSPYWQDENGKRVAGGSGKNWSPSTRIEDAWQVGTRLYKFGVLQAFDTIVCQLIDTELTDEISFVNIFLCSEQEAATAICRAALKAIYDEEMEEKK